MSRLEEVNETIKEVKDVIQELNEHDLTSKQITNMELASIVTFLGEISVSMAMIVDRLSERGDEHDSQSL